MTQHRLANDLKEAPMPASGRGLYSQPLGGHMIGWGSAVPSSAEGWAPGAMFVKTSDPPALYINKGTVAASNFLLSVDGALLAAGSGVPVDTTAGYAPGSLYIDTTTKKLYINQGTAESCAFADISNIPLSESGEAVAVPLLGGNLLNWDDAVPADDTPGYPPGALFFLIDEPPAVYMNLGDDTECEFVNIFDPPHADEGSAISVPGLGGHMLNWGAAKPTDTDPGYPPGALFIKTAATPKLYINGGTAESCAFTDTLNVAMSDAGEAIAVPTLGGAMIQWGEAAPADAGAGYPPGALFIKTAATPTLYINVGTAESCNFDPIALVA